MENFISDFNEACAKLGISTDLPNFLGFAENKRKREEAAYKLETIIEANNGDWKPVIANTTQEKWYPIFLIHKDESRPSGFRLSFDGYGCADDDSALGARLACKNEELAQFMGENCTELYEIAHA